MDSWPEITPDEAREFLEYTLRSDVIEFVNAAGKRALVDALQPELATLGYLITPADQPHGQ